MNKPHEEMTCACVGWDLGMNWVRVACGPTSLPESNEQGWDVVSDGSLVLK